MEKGQNEGKVVGESSIEEEEFFLGYCHKQSATILPEQIEEEVMGVKQLKTVVVTHWLECIGEECNYWCEEEEMCIDTCEHKNKFVPNKLHQPSKIKKDKNQF